MRWRAFPLHPETPPEGMSLEDLFAGSGLDVGAMLHRLETIAAELDLPFGVRTMTYNSRLASELGLWAEQQGRGHRFHLAAFHAYFARGRNLHDRTVLLELAHEAGLDPDAAEVVLDERLFRLAVDRDWDASRKLGIRAVPSLVMGQEILTGAQPYAAMAQMLRSHGVKNNSG